MLSRAVLVVALALGILARSAAAEPTVGARSVVAIDAATGAELFAKDADSVRNIASTTKIFVAILVRKRGLALDEYTKITKGDAAAARGGARTRLDIGEQFKNRDLLRAMLMASDNRAPTALGRATGLGQDELVAELNKLAQELGLTHTRFTDPTGLRGNVSTAREMAIGLKTALEDKVLREIMGDQSATVISKDRYSKIAYLTTNAPLVTRKFDVVGGKTGFTTPAGYCFVTAARIHGREVLFALLGSKSKTSRWDDFNAVARWLEGRVTKTK